MELTTTYARYALKPGMLILRGVLAIAFGLMVLAWPGPGLLAIALLYGAYAFADGILAFTTGVKRGKHSQSWGLFILEGILGMGVGIITLFWPGITLMVLAVLMGVWALITGVLEIAGAFQLHHALPSISTLGRVLLGLAGVLSLALGVAIFMIPELGVFTLLTLVASYALIFGVLMVALGMRLKHEQKMRSTLTLDRAA